MPMIGARSNARGATDPNPRLQASHAARAFSIPLWVPMPMERLRANFFLQLHWIDVKGWGWEGPLPSRFCCYWCLLRPSQSQSQIQIKTEMFRKRSITYHTTSSILPFSPFYWSGRAPRALFCSQPFVYSFTKAVLSTASLDVNASLQ